MSFLDSTIPRDDIDPTGPVPTFGNPGSLTRPRVMPGVGEFRRCADCSVTWRGDEPCWSCGGAA